MQHQEEDKGEYINDHVPRTREAYSVVTGPTDLYACTGQHDDCSVYVMMADNSDRLRAIPIKEKKTIKQYYDSPESTHFDIDKEYGYMTYLFHNDRTLYSTQATLSTLLIKFFENYDKDLSTKVNMMNSLKDQEKNPNFEKLSRLLNSINIKNPNTGVTENNLMIISIIDIGNVGTVYFALQMSLKNGGTFGIAMYFVYHGYIGQSLGSNAVWQSITAVNNSGENDKKEFPIRRRLLMDDGDEILAHKMYLFDLQLMKPIVVPQSTHDQTSRHHTHSNSYDLDHDHRDAASQHTQPQASDSISMHIHKSTKNLPPAIPSHLQNYLLAICQEHIYTNSQFLLDLYEVAARVLYQRQRSANPTYTFQNFEQAFETWRVPCVAP